MEHYLKINDVEYEIKFVESNHEGLNSKDSSSYLGTHWSKRNIIFIDKSLGDGQMMQVIAHEIAHAIIWSSSPISSDVDEEFLCNFIGCHFKKIYELTTESFKLFKKDIL